MKRNRLCKFVAILSLIIVSLSVFPFDAHTYDSQSAYIYAQEYWNKVASDGYFFEKTYAPTYIGSGEPIPDLPNTPEYGYGLGFDCAHFVSCSIGNEPNEQGGGLSVPSRTEAYGEPGAQRLGNWLLDPDNSIAVEVSSINQLVRGDVINYDWDGDGDWDHAAFYLGNDLVAAHSESVWSEHWQLGGFAQGYRFIHIVTSEPYVSISKTIRSDSDNIIDLTSPDPNDGSRDVIFRVILTNTGGADARVSTDDDLAAGDYYCADPGAPCKVNDVTVVAGGEHVYDYRARYQGSNTSHGAAITNTARITWIHNYYNETTGEDYGGHGALTSNQTAYLHNSVPVKEPWIIKRLDEDTLMYNSIAIDSYDRAHISYLVYGTGLKYATNKGGSWTIETIDSGSVGQYSSIGLDSSNKVHISYDDWGNGDLKYATNKGGSWATEMVDSEGNVGAHTSLVIDSLNNVHISYRGETGAKLKYATNKGGSWAIETVDSHTWAEFDTSIAIDSSDKVHISYYDWGNGDLKYATNKGGLWATETVDSEGDVGFCNSIAIDSSDKVHISYWNRTNNDLKYATNKGGLWTFEMVDSVGTVGRANSIAIDSSDKVHISYWNEAANDLKYATNKGGSWAIKILDSVGNVEPYTSIAIDSLDKAHISYHGSLKYATNRRLNNLPFLLLLLGP